MLARKRDFFEDFVGSLVDEIFTPRELMVIPSSMAEYDYDSDTKEHVITIHAPGFKKDEIKLEIDNRGLNIAGEIKDEKRKAIRKKFSYLYGKNGINPDSVNASLEDGILTIRFKTDQGNNSKTIEIK
jgi:HSP20 family molecular chaperone IbpA